MRSILLVGSIGAGKTTFRRCLQGLPIRYAKTQAIGIFAFATDTPDEYLEVGHYKRALMLASYDMDVVVLMQSATSDEIRFPPGSATTSNRGVLGVTTHAGVVTEAQVYDAIDHLTRIGAYRIMAVGSVTGKGFKCVRGVLCRTSS